MISVLKRIPSVTFRISYKTLHILSSSKLNKSYVKEIKIPVPWGHIAGRWWGRTDVQPIVALHGVQDNAATFNNLAPLLNTDALLALDLPGHGWSSHLPIGIPYSYRYGVAALRYVLNVHNNWKKPILLGHSFGSSLILFYASLYPDEIDTYISIDCPLHMLSFKFTKYLDQLHVAIDKSLNYEKTINVPGYTYEELLDLFYVGRKKLITKESCEILLSRGINKLPSGKVNFSRDVRVKLKASDYFTEQVFLELAPKIKCKVLMIQAENGAVKNNNKAEVVQKFVDLITKNAVKSEQVILKGNHHLHLDNADDVAQVINTFLKSTSRRNSI